MNNSIGFSNFRRFTKFPEIDLGDITILVGGNNAGKSTLVKAMLLMRDFLKSRVEGADNSDNTNNTFEPHFSFDTEHVNVGDFYRAFCRQSPRKEETISFTMKIDKFRFVVNIRGERKPGVIPEVSLIAVSDEDRDIAFTFDFSKYQMTARFGNDNEAYNDNLFNDRKYLQKKKESLTVKLHELNKTLSDCKDFEMITAGKSEIERVQLELKQIQLELNKKEKDLKKEDYTIRVNGAGAIDLYFYKGIHAGKLIIPELIMGFAKFADDGTLGDRRSKNYKEEEANKTFLRGKITKIREIAEDLETILNKQVIEYIYAHSVFQDSVYANCANSSDYTKRTIHEFYTSRISQGDEEFSMIEDWLDEFKIGKSLKVIPYKGDNYSLVIFDKENPEIISDKRKGYPGGIDLADKGMGSIQIVILLLRLATLIRKYKGQQLTILLEEPEQNLHPALQSKLADLIFEISQKFGLRFIIETHSEYLVRHSQVIAAKQLFEEGVSLSTINETIKVYYISQERGVVDMLFLDNAKFDDHFDEGFFDQAARESLTISRLERINKNK
jgi:predicted ATP-dependent endonuclease of OLD family